MHPNQTQIETETTKTREEFWSLWARLRTRMPGKSRLELQAADHAAWLMFNALQAKPSPNAP